MRKRSNVINIVLSGLILSVLSIPGIALASAPSSTITEAFGMNMHLRQRIPQADWETVLTAANDAGVEWSREQFNWDAIEPIDGTFDFTAYDAVVDAYAAHNSTVVGLLTYSSSWASGNSGATDYEFYPPDNTAWQNYVAKVTQHYADTIDTWEIWNEPNHDGFWKGSVDDYVTLLDTASLAIKTANPDAKIVLGGLSGSDANYLDQVYDLLSDPSAIDIVAIHPYRIAYDSPNYAPETVVDGLNTLTNDIYNIKAVLNQHGQTSTPIWLTEVGWTTGDTGVTPQQQADYLTRLYTQALAIPNVAKVFWYSFTDTSSDESYNDAQFGLLEDDYTPKTAFTAYRYVKKHLAGRRYKDQTLPSAQIVDDFSAAQGWSFAGTVCTNGTVNDHYNGTLAVTYKFTSANNCYAPITFNKKLAGPTRALQFKASGSDDDTFLRVRLVDNTGETFQYNLGYLPSTWLYYTIQLDQASSHWGGDNDGKLDQPLTFNAFVLDDTDGSLAQGSVSFDDLISTARSHTYLYRFHKDSKDVYAYWTSKQRRVLNVHLTGAGKMREYALSEDSVLHESGSTYYPIHSERAVKFLQTL